MGMTKDQMMARIAELESLKAALEAKNAPKVGMKVSAKGALSIYGVQRFPVTLYAGQWEAILEKKDAIKAFIAANSATLKRKDTADVTPPAPEVPATDQPSV